MIVIFTDFGTEGPYMGQMRAVLNEGAPGIAVVDLMVDAPAFDIRAASYLLPAAMTPFPAGTVCLGVVDPGVGGARRAIVLQADGHWFVGPDNGLFEMVRRRAVSVCVWEITWRPRTMSASFHGRDLFAPVAARIAAEGEAALDGLARRADLDGEAFTAWADDWPAVIYIDRYGNCMTGMRFDAEDGPLEVTVGGNQLPLVRTFSDVVRGAPLCYANSLGLLEIAIRTGNAAEKLGLKPGSQVSVRKL